MKLISKRLLMVVGGVFFISLAACSSLGSKTNVEIPPYQEVKLKNGMVVLMIQDQELPYVSYVMMVKSGSSEDPEGQKGLSSMVGDLLSQGTNKRNAVQIADSLGQIGARFNVSTSLDFTLITASGLSYHQDNLLNDFSEIITQPSFAQKEVNRLKAKRLSQLKQTVDDPADLAGVAFDKYLYGTHSYGQRVMGSLTDVQKLSKKSITRYYLQNFRPNNSYLAVVGQFDPKEMKQKLETSFGDWAPRESSPPKLGEAPPIAGVKIQLVDKGDLKQTQIRMGYLGINRTNPDFLKLRVANTILGGAFASRLMQEIREKRGLTYSISSRFEAYKDPGPFMISTFTRHDKVNETVKTTLEVLNTFKEKGVTDQEVEDVKGYLVGIFPRSLETPEALAMNLLVLRYYGISEDYLKDYVENIEDISTDEVNEAIKKYITPENIKVLVLSPKSKALGQLKGLGEVEVKSYKSFL